MIDLSIFTQLAINMGAIQLPPLADVIRLPPLGNVEEREKINELKIQLVSQNTETDIMMSDSEFSFEERAAILEYDGGYSRAEAERLARIEIYGDNA